MERRDFLRLASGSLASLVLGQTFPDAAHSAGLTNPIVYLPKNDLPRIAWTVDDGCSQESVRRYIELAIEKDIRLTFFVYSAMAPWRNNFDLLKPLVDSGQIQLANHTQHHRDLTQLSYAEVQKELMGCHYFIKKTYGVDARPYYRAPYGAINRSVMQAAADVGYTKPFSWSGSLADAGTIKPSRLLYHAGISIEDGGILIGHANNLVAVNNFDKLMKMVDTKNLSLVTLKDVFG